MENKTAIEQLIDEMEVLKVHTVSDNAVWIIDEAIKLANHYNQVGIKMKGKINIEIYGFTVHESKADFTKYRKPTLEGEYLELWVFGNSYSLDYIEKDERRHICFERYIVDEQSQLDYLLRRGRMSAYFSEVLKLGYSELERKSFKKGLLSAIDGVISTVEAKLLAAKKRKPAPNTPQQIHNGARIKAYLDIRQTLKHRKARIENNGGEETEIA